jgi:large subunit ribosomal protein L30
MADAKKVRITLVRSPIGYEKSQGDTVRALGLHRMHESRVVTLSPQIGGMVNKVIHLLRVEEVSE